MRVVIIALIPLLVVAGVDVVIFVVVIFVVVIFVSLYDENLLSFRQKVFNNKDTAFICFVSSRIREAKGEMDGAEHGHEYHQVLFEYI